MNRIAIAFSIGLIFIWIPLADAKVKVGVICSRTGPYANVGNEIALTTDVFIRPQNKGIEVEICDDESTPQGASLCAERLVSKSKAIAIVGPSFPSAAEPVREILDKMGTPQISLAPERPDYMKRPRTFFRIGTSVGRLISVATDFVVNNLKPQYLGLILDNSLLLPSANWGSLFSDKYATKFQQFTHLSRDLPAAGESLVLPFERRGQLVAYLALKRAWVARSELAALLWPGQEAKLAQANVRKALFRLQELPWAAAIEAQGGAVRLEVETDVAAFEAALRERRLAEALALRRGELLAGFEDDANEAWSGWLGFERDRLRAAWRGAALERLPPTSTPPRASTCRCVSWTPTPSTETAMGEHVKWLARSGQAARARHAYREVAERLMRELGIGPGTELAALHDSVVASPSPAAPGIAGQYRIPEYVPRKTNPRRQRRLEHRPAIATWGLWRRDSRLLAQDR